MTTLYLDVDGVLNASMPQGWGKTASGKCASQDSPPWELRWAPGMIDALNGLTGVWIVWTTTWCQDAKDGVQPLMGLTLPSRVLMPLSGEVTFPSIDWKFESILFDRHDRHDDFIWLDDELEKKHVDTAAKLGGLAVPINPRTGISPADIQRINQYMS